MSKYRYLILSLCLALGVSHADPLTNLVVNGGFETGSFSGWTLSGNTTPCLFVGVSGDPRCIPTTGIGPHSGSYAAELGNATYDAFLSQNVVTTVGATYELSFWLASQGYGTPFNDFSVNWDGRQIYSAANLPASGYQFYDFSGLTASTASTALTFGFSDTPSYLILDDVSVVDPPKSMPETGTMMWFAVALTLLAVLQRRGLPARRVPR
ncbi:MAG: hypothetical protein LAP40_04100 [Acidobacteriia bacterium]|nr:hypothetical protein [Terriglobia bacterium]